MIKIFIILNLLNLIKVSAQDQDIYTIYLSKALQAVDNVNEKEFDHYLRTFTVSIEKNQLRPESLSEANFKLYIQCLYESVINRIFLEEDLAIKALEFIKYDIENRPQNMVVMGVFYQEGIVVPQNDFQAQLWFEKAAKNGNPDAMIHLVYAYSSEDEKNDKFWQETAVQIYKEAAEKGDVEAMLKLAFAYESPLALYEAEKVIFWSEKAAELGSTKAMYYLGYCYEVGINGEEDCEKAIYWYEKAANKGHLLAMYSIAGIYYTGDGDIQKDVEKAKHWLAKSCNSGYINACYFYEFLD